LTVHSIEEDELCPLPILMPFVKSSILITTKSSELLIVTINTRAMRED
jgi:hypothetical protein